MKLIFRNIHAEISEVAISQVAFALMQIFIPWLAATRAPLADLAMLSLAQTVVWPLSMMSQLQLRTIYLTQGDPRLLPLFMQLRLASCAVLLVGTSLATGFLHSGALLFGLVLVLGLIKCLENVADIVHMELQRALNLTRAARSLTFRCIGFIVLYAACLLATRDILFSLLAGFAAMAGWVLLVDMRPGSFWFGMVSHRGDLHHMAATLKAGLCLSSALAFSSLAVMVGRWAAERSGDMESVAAASLAGTMASVVALVLGTTQQFCLTGARTQLDTGGVPAFRRWCSGVTRHLHVVFGGLAIAWVASVLLSSVIRLPLPGSHGGGAMQETVVALAGAFLATGWLSVLCFADTLLLAMERRYMTILLIAVLQVVAAFCASLLLYPMMGWTAIGIAEFVRGITFFVAVRYAGQRLEPVGQVA